MQIERRVQPALKAVDPQDGATSFDPIWVLANHNRRPGRPPEMTATELLERIRRLAAGRDGLFRVHHRNSSLYARARRNFGSWSAAVEAAGLDYRGALNDARGRAVRSRRRARRSGIR